eukprot:GHVT01062143.1.p1 GENE.GHVT01062143.1~~GHVT01062143.1.p1  ORF type:complete len:368 (-),score=74.15 GHVT01062143.1:2058-3161(-)
MDVGWGTDNLSEAAPADNANGQPNWQTAWGEANPATISADPAAAAFDFAAPAAAADPDAVPTPPKALPSWRQQQLTDELERFDRVWIQPPPEQHARKNALIAEIGKAVDEAAQGLFKIFGSCTNGFWIRGSDVDLCLLRPELTTAAAMSCFLRTLARRISVCPSVKQAIVIGARIPIIKIYDRFSKLVCDFSINNATGIENSALSFLMGQLDPRVRPLGRFIKYWAAQRRINNRTDGMLSTYTLLMQLVFFLQTRTPAVIPPYQTIELYKATEAPPVELYEAASRPGPTKASSQRTSTNSWPSPPPLLNPPLAPLDLSKAHAAMLVPHRREYGGVLRPLPFLTDPKYTLQTEKKYAPPQHALTTLLV